MGLNSVFFVLLSKSRSLCSRFTVLIRTNPVSSSWEAVVVPPSSRPLRGRKEPRRFTLAENGARAEFLNLREQKLTFFLSLFLYFERERERDRQTDRQ